MIGLRTTSEFDTHKEQNDNGGYYWYKGVTHEWYYIDKRGFVHESLNKNSWTRGSNIQPVEGIQIIMPITIWDT